MLPTSSQYRCEGLWSFCTTVGGNDEQLVGIADVRTTHRTPFIAVQDSCDCAMDRLSSWIKVFFTADAEYGVREVAFVLLYHYKPELC